MKTKRKPRRKKPKFLDWHGCYDANWNGYIVPEAFAHPAKFARGLVERIYKHMLEMKWLKRGDVVFDPFAGIGNGGIIGASLGLQWIGVELEERFVGFARQNFELHRRVWEKMGDPLPVIIHGDSRNAAALVRAHGVVTSPPFSGTEQPCASQTRMKKDYHAFTRGNGTKRDATMTGETPGQLGAMETGDFDAAISSPPYADSVDSQQHGIDWTKVGPATGNRKRGEGSRHEETLRNQLSYGTSDGQLGAMKEGAIDAALSSPPYAESPVTGESNFQSAKCPNSQQARHVRATGGTDAALSSPPYAESIGNENHIDYSKGKTLGGGKKPSPARSAIGGSYGETDGNLGNLKEGEIDGALSSPPYEQQVHDRNGIDETKFTQQRFGPNTQAKAGGYPKAGAK